jgi:hypothetical protein
MFIFRTIKIYLVLNSVVVVIGSLLLSCCGSHYPPSYPFPKRAINCQLCLSGEECLRSGIVGEHRTCGIKCGIDRPNTRCPQGFFCAAGNFDGDPTACVPIMSASQDITKWGRPLCVLNDDGYIFWTRGRNRSEMKTGNKQWRIAEGCTTDIDESYTAVCAPGTEPAPVVNKVPCETITSKRYGEGIQGTEEQEKEPETVPSAEDTGNVQEEIQNTEEMEKIQSPPEERQKKD